MIINLTLIFLVSMCPKMCQNYENKYYLQDKIAYKIVNMQSINYIDDNIFKPDENQSYKCYTIERFA